MLAQNFKTAAELDLTAHEHDALIKTLALLDTGKLIHVPEIVWGGSAFESFTGHFNMNEWHAYAECGTVCCIGGTAERLSAGKVNFDEERGSPLYELFYAERRPRGMSLKDITVPQAGMALRSYLTIGDARWDLAFED